MNSKERGGNKLQRECGTVHVEPFFLNSYVSNCWILRIATEWHNQLSLFPNKYTKIRRVRNKKEARPS